MAEIHDLNPTDASNTARFPEGQAPSTVNNGARALEGLIARYFFDQDTSVSATLSGSVIKMTANRNSLTLTGTTSNYVANFMQAFTMGANPNTGPASVSIDGVGPISLRDNTGLSLSSSVIPSGCRALVVKDGTNNYFRLLYPVTAAGIGLGTIATQNANNVAITGGSVTGITDLVVADGGTGLSAATAYAVLCGGTTSTAALQSIASVGSSGQVLTSNGAAALPTFQAIAASGALTWVETKTDPGTNGVTLGEGNIESGYDYIISMVSTKWSADMGAGYPVLQYGTGAGPTYQTANYVSQNMIIGADAIIASRNGLTNGIPFADVVEATPWGGTTAGEFINAHIEILDPAANDVSPAAIHAWGYDSGGNQFEAFISGQRTTSEVKTGFRIMPNSTQTATGTFVLYKRKRSA